MTVKRPAVVTMKLVVAVVLFMSFGGGRGWAEDTDPMPNEHVRPYWGGASGGTGIEHIELSRSSISFSNLVGRMNLRWVGIRTRGSRDGFAQGDVYEVLNAQQFFSSNRRSGFCPSPVRWMIVGTRQEDNIPGGMILATFLSAKDWRNYNPSGPGLCGDYMYVLDWEISRSAR